MRKLLAILILATLPAYGFASELPTKPRPEILLQAGTTYALEFSKIIHSITTSDMPVASKERAITVAKEAILALQRQESERLLSIEKEKGATIGTYFRWIGEIITVGAGIFLSIKAAQ